MLNSGLFNKLKSLSESKGKYMDSPESVKVRVCRGLRAVGALNCLPAEEALPSLLGRRRQQASAEGCQWVL